MLGAVLRYWGIGFGLPNLECRPDENRTVPVAMRMWEGDLNPRSFEYPTLYMHLVAGAWSLDLLLGLATGGYRSVRHFTVQMVERPEHFYWMARCVTAALGTATLLALCRAVATLLGARAGLLAALLLAVAHLHVRDSHFATTDVPMTLLVVVTLGFVARHAHGAGRRDHLWAGIAAGLAVSTKYSAVLLVLAFLVAHWQRGSREGLAWLARLRDRRAWAFALALGLAFVAGSPFALPERALLLARGCRGFDEWTLRPDRSGFLVNGEPTAELPDYVVVQEHPLLAHYSFVPPAVARLLERRYRERASFPGIGTEAVDARFDLQDAFYLPLAGFSAVQRPGPNLRIHQRVE